MGLTTSFLLQSLWHHFLTGKGAVCDTLLCTSVHVFSNRNPKRHPVAVKLAFWRLKFYSSGKGTGRRKGEREKRLGGEGR